MKKIVRKKGVIDDNGVRDMKIAKRKKMVWTPRAFGLVFLGLFFLGCASSHGTSGDGYVRPSSSSHGQGKTPATQKPYRIHGKKYIPIANARGFVQKGIASWYGKKFHGRKTSNGEIYNMYAMTAAHKTLPMGTWVLVENLENQRQIKVRVNDRGPFVRGRIIDLSYSGARKLGMVGPGTAKVRIRALGQATAYAGKSHSPVKFRPVNYWKGNFTVQVGAFKEKSNAQRYRDKLSRTYINAHIVVHEDYRGRFYRVRMGKFSNLANAEKFSLSLMGKGFGQVFAVAE